MTKIIFLLDKKWKTLKFHKNYKVSNYGRVKNKTTGRILRNRKSSSGQYPTVAITVNGKVKNFYVHRLVAEYFIGECPEGHLVNHINPDRMNAYYNAVWNLEYVTQKENMRHAHRVGLCNSKKGIECHFSKLNENDILKIRKLDKNGVSQKRIAEKFNTDCSNVNIIVNRKTWKHIA